MEIASSGGEARVFKFNDDDDEDYIHDILKGRPNGRRRQDPRDDSNDEEYNCEFPVRMGEVKRPDKHVKGLMTSLKSMLPSKHKGVHREEEGCRRTEGNDKRLANDVRLLQLMLPKLHTCDVEDMLGVSDEDDGNDGIEDDKGTVHRNKNGGDWREMAATETVQDGVPRYPSGRPSLSVIEEGAQGQGVGGDIPSVGIVSSGREARVFTYDDEDDEDHVHDILKGRPHRRRRQDPRDDSDEEQYQCAFPAGMGEDKSHVKHIDTELKGWSKSLKSLLPLKHKGVDGGEGGRGRTEGNDGSLVDDILLLRSILPKLVMQTIKEMQGDSDKDDGNDGIEEKRTVYGDNNSVPRYPSGRTKLEVTTSPGGEAWVVYNDSNDEDYVHDILKGGSHGRRRQDPHDNSDDEE